MSLLAASTGGLGGDAFRNVLIGACSTIATAVLVWLGHKAAKLIDRITNVLAEVEPEPAKIEYRTDAITGERTPIVVDRGRPGVQGQIADLRASLDAVREELSSAAESMRALGNVPAQIAANREALEERFAEAERLQREMVRLAADAATKAATADQRVAELADLVGAQIEGLHLENQVLRTALFDTAVSPTAPEAGA